jgi:hypothetical protein
MCESATVSTLANVGLIFRFDADKQIVDMLSFSSLSVELLSALTAL